MKHAQLLFVGNGFVFFWKKLFCVAMQKLNFRYTFAPGSLPQTALCTLLPPIFQVIS